MQIGLRLKTLIDEGVGWSTEPEALSASNNETVRDGEGASRYLSWTISAASPSLLPIGIS